MSDKAIIETRSAELTFGGEAGVRDLTMRVPPGIIFGMIGPSGAGKTTAVRLLTGIHRPSRGEVRVFGVPPSAFTARARERIGYMPQLFTLYPNLTVLENLNFVASLYGMGYFRRRERTRRLLEIVELTDARRRLGSQLSGGMQRRLSLACALVHSPQLIFADEPTAGIDPVLRGKLWEHFRSLRDEGRTLVVTTQYVGEAAYCDVVGVMREGRLLFVDTPEGLRQRALGGDVLRIQVDPQQIRPVEQVLLNLPFVSDVHRERTQPGLLYVYVEQAGAALPQIFAALNERPGLEVRAAEEYQPPFDDIFVTLMEREDAAQMEDARAANAA
jgi:ABC-2 type transport system ATP-binding protein